MYYNKKKIFFAFIVVIIYAIALNEWNINTISKLNNVNANTRSLVHNYAIFSIDNEWYLPQIKNLLVGKGFTSNPEREHYDVRRTPVYPLFYGFHYLLFGEVNSFFFIRFTQIIIFALATIALFFATFNFTKNKKIAFVIAIIYGFNPTLVSYLYFTITEAISPSLVCFLFYFLSRCYINNKKQDWFFTGLFFAMAALCRPAIFFFAPALFFAFIYINRKSFKIILLNGLFVLLGCIMLFLPHIVRNYIVTNGDLVILEKYYGGDPMDLGIPNIKLRDWISCWKNPANYSSEVISNTIKVSILYDSTSTQEKVVTQLITKLPKEATMVNNKEDIINAYGLLYNYYYAIIKEYSNVEIAFAEQKSIAKFQALKDEFIEKKPFQYYIKTPVQIFSSVVFQSNASTISMLDNYETSTIKKLVKMILYLLNVFLFFAIVGNLLYVRKYTFIYSVSLIYIAITVLYITYNFRYFEVRYLIPIFPCMYILGAIFIVETTKMIRSKLNF